MNAPAGTSVMATPAHWPFGWRVPARRFSFAGKEKRRCRRVRVPPAFRTSALRRARSEDSWCSDPVVSGSAIPWLGGWSWLGVFARLPRGHLCGWDDRAVRWRLVSLGLALAAIGCGLVAFLERHVSTSSLPNVGIAGAYFNRSTGPPSFTSVLYAKGDWFDPFKFSVPYLWLGLAVGLAIGAAAVVVVGRGST
jgi:hypothetical protein